MRTVRMLAIAAALALAAPLAGFAIVSAAASRSQDVIVLLTGPTEVNREALNFLYRGIVSNGAPWRLAYTMKASDIKPGKFRAVIVLSTAVSGGVEPSLESFIQAYPAKQEIILVSLLRGSTSWSVTQAGPGQNPLGVDALSAATAWGRGFGRGFGSPGTGSSGTAGTTTYSGPVEMHQAWVQDVLALLAH